MSAGPLLGRVLDLEVGAVAQGGACVARHEGRVVFVRHTLPGERVRAVVTEDRGGSFCRADAVEVLTASADRVPPPCEHAGPGGCGGCDWQHASGPAQRAGKAAVVAEQFRRLAGLELPGLTVEELPGGLLGWRTRVQYAVDRDGRPGLHRHHSADLEHLAACPLGASGVGDSAVLARRWPGLSGVEVAVNADGTTAWLARRPGAGRQSRGRRPPDRVELVDGPATLRHEVAGRAFEVSAGGFWQVHPAAAQVLTEAVLAAARPAAGETVLDLYAGAGMLTAALAGAVGLAGRVLGLESDAQAVADAAVNLADLPQAVVHRGRVGPEAVRELGPADVVVLDPPRAGAGTETMRALAEAGARVLVYVSCDPATLARDVAALTRAGWQLAELRAFDAFPMTHHVECLAVLVPDGHADPHRPGGDALPSSG